MKTSKQIYAVQEKSSFSAEIVPYTIITANTRELAREWIKAHIWKYIHDTWDTWDEIDPSELNQQIDIFGNIPNWEDTVLLKRRKTGEVIMIYIDRLYLITR